MLISRRNFIVGATGAGLLVATRAAPWSSANSPARLPSLRPGGPAQVGPWRVLAGSLHDHSTDSDGDSRDSDIVDWLAAHRAELGIDYATLSDHSDFFPVAGGVVEAPANDMGIPNLQPTPCPPTTCAGYVTGWAADPAALVELWRRQGDLATKYSSDEFSFLRGFEWTNDQQNHLDVLLSSNWTSRAVTGDGAMSMAPFWAWFDADPVNDPTGHGLGFGGGDGVGMFNHPGDKGALNWDDYGLDDNALGRMALIEVHGDQSMTGRGDSDAGWYWFALAKGWHVSPTMDWDWHEWQSGGVLGNKTPGAGYGGEGYLPGQRSLVLARDARQTSMREALLARRTSAAEIPDLWAALRSGDAWQGELLDARPGDRVRLTVEAGSATEPLARVDIIGDNGIDPAGWYDGDNASWDSPHSQLTPSYVVQHERYVASGGRTTKKQRIDGPPPGSLVASVPLSGSRDSATIEVTVPTASGPRPDGRHFFYAIVSTANSQLGPARCWSGPLLTAAG